MISSWKLHIIKVKKTNNACLTRTERRRTTMQVNILEAKTEQSKLIRLIEIGYVHNPFQ